MINSFIKTKENNIQLIKIKKALNKNDTYNLFYRLLYFKKRIFIIFIIYLLIKIFSKKIKKNNIINKNIFFNNYIKGINNSLKFKFLIPRLDILNKKRTLIKRLPLPKSIKCISHFRKKELIGFLSLLTNNTIFFETGSGCSSIMAKYYAKKTYAIEGCKKYYDIGIKNGLKDVLIFKDLKPDKTTWSYPGKKSNINDWKNYFQSYKKEYNADVILIDGRFKVATAMDIFNKIRNDTIILIHEYKYRPLYFVIEDYYNYIYNWDSLYAFVKKTEIKEIPLNIQKK